MIQDYPGAHQGIKGFLIKDYLVFWGWFLLLNCTMVDETKRWWFPKHVQNHCLILSKILGGGYSNIVGKKLPRKIEGR